MSIARPINYVVRVKKLQYKVLLLKGFFHLEKEKRLSLQ